MFCLLQRGGGEGEGEEEGGENERERKRERGCVNVVSTSWPLAWQRTNIYIYISDVL